MFRSGERTFTTAECTFATAKHKTKACFIILQSPLSQTEDSLYSTLKTAFLTTSAIRFPFGQQVIRS